MDSNTVIKVLDTSVSTAFVETGSRVVDSKVSNTSKGDFLVKDQTLADFIAKPVLISNGLWAITDAADTTLVTINPAVQLLGNAIWSNKISGHRLIRGTAVLRIEINASPFQQGKLLIYWVPDIDATNSRMHRTGLASKTQLPCVEMSTANTSCEFKVPFLSPYDWFDVKTQDFDWGDIYIDVLSPLLTGSGGPTTVGYNIYLSFEDFEFTTPVVPQMECVPVDIDVNVAQMAKVKHSKFSKEVDVMADKPISTALSYGAKAAQALSSIPVLAPVTDTVAWAMNLASGVAGVFGWSKPSTMVAPSVMVPQANRYMANADGVDTSVPIGLIADRATTVIDTMSITNEDEMSFNFLKSKSAMVASANWDTTQAASTLLISKTIGPKSYTFKEDYSNKSTHSGLYRVGPPISYLANRFDLWRGSICCVLKLVKTNFHTGRLEVTWTPGTDTFTEPTTTTSAYSLREIIDISDADEVCLMLPYLLAQDYISTSLPSGKLMVRVLAPLRCPETASSSVQILQYFSGGPDFEFQVPINGVSTQPFYAQMESVPVDTNYCVAQMESAMVNEDVVAPSGILCNGGPVDLERSARDIGESFTSVKQLLNRQSRVYYKYDDPYTGYQAIINPWFTSISTLVDGTGLLGSPICGGDMYSFISPMYAYFRGDARIGLQLAGPTAATNYSYATVVARPAKPAFTATWSIEGQTPNTLSSIVTWVDPTVTIDGSTSHGVTVLDPHGYSSVICPYYSSGKASLVKPQKADAAYSTVDRSDPRSAVTVACPALADASVNTYRSMADSFQLTFYLGCPPVLITYI